MKNYTVHPHDVTPVTPHTLLKILKSNSIDTEWIEYLSSLKGITELWTTRRCVELINQFDIELPDNIFGVTCNPVSEGDY